MPRSSLRCGLLLVALLGLVSGCGSGDPEKALVATWQMSSTGQAAIAAKLKKDSPSSSTSDIMAAARGFRETKLDLREDKTFELHFMGGVRQGTWTYDKDTREVALTMNKPAAAANAAEQPAQDAAAEGAANDAAKQADAAAANADHKADQDAGLEPQPEKPVVWAAYLNESNDGLKFYPVPKESVAMLKKEGIGLADGIPLGLDGD